MDWNGPGWAVVTGGFARGHRGGDFGRPAGSGRAAGRSGHQLRWRTRRKPRLLRAGRIVCGPVAGPPCLQADVADFGCAWRQCFAEAEGENWERCRSLGQQRPGCVSAPRPTFWRPTMRSQGLEAHALQVNVNGSDPHRAGGP